jgi:hypothetical protein
MEIILDHPRARATVKYDDRRQIAILKVTDDKRIVMFKVLLAKESITKPVHN